MNDVEKPNHGISDADSFECKVCGRKFASKQGLGTHLTRTHGRGRRVAQTPRVISGEHRVKAERFNRPLDLDRLAKYETEQFILGGIEDMEYRDAVRQFLPVLAREIDRRDINSPLMSVLVALTIDAS